MWTTLFGIETAWGRVWTAFDIASVWGSVWTALFGIETVWGSVWTALFGIEQAAVASCCEQDEGTAGVLKWGDVFDYVIDN